MEWPADIAATSVDADSPAEDCRERWLLGVRFDLNSAMLCATPSASMNLSRNSGIVRPVTLIRNSEEMMDSKNLQLDFE